MFKRKFKDEFDFSERSFSFTNANESKNFDRSIYVVYDKFELIEFLQLDKKGTNVLVCLFNKKLYASLAFLEEINNLIVLDDTKTKPQITNELKVHFKNKSVFNYTQKDISFSNAPIFQSRFQNLYKALFFLM